MFPLAPLRPRLFALLLLLPAGFAPSTLAFAPPAGAVPAHAAPGKIAPDFTLAQAYLSDAKANPAEKGATSPVPFPTLPQKSLSSLRGHSVAMFFVCGCARCGEVVREWTQFLPPPAAPSSAASAQTVLVFYGTGDEARSFAQRTGLTETVGRADASLRPVTLLLDPNGRVTERVYHVEECPCAFVLDAAGIISRVVTGQESKGVKSSALTRSDADEQAEVAWATAMVAQTRQALEKIKGGGKPVMPPIPATKGS